MWLWVVLTLAGLAFRLALLPVSPPVTYLPDHDDFMRWSIQATDRGLWTLYTEPPPRRDYRRWDGESWRTVRRAGDRVFNYPPAAAYVVWSIGVLFEALSTDRLINTVASHVAFSSWGIVGDLLLAAGCGAIVRRYQPGVWPLITYGLALLWPPLWWDTMLWPQTDSWLLAPAVWMVHALLGRRWLAAGLLYGLMLGLKPQAILFVPVWGLALVLGRPVWRVAVGLALAGAVLLLLAAPFIASSGWTWWRLSYVENLTGTYVKYTTLKAFNIWYLDYLSCGSLDASRTLAGVTKATWGQVLLGVVLAGGLSWWVWRRRKDSAALLGWTAFVLLAFVLLPTSVHERYLILAIPFLLIAAVLRARLWPGLLLLTLVLMGQVTWPLWLAADRGTGGQWWFTILGLLGGALALAGLLSAEWNSAVGMVPERLSHNWGGSQRDARAGRM